MRIRQFLMLLSIALLLLSDIANAQVETCGEPPANVDSVIKGEVDGKAAFLKTFVGDIGLKGKLEIAKNDVLSKYPNADKLHLEKYFLYVVCVLIMTDTRLPIEQKTQQWLLAWKTIMGMPAQDIFGIEVDYSVCQGQYKSKCPKEAVHIPCGASLPDWVRKECAQYSFLAAHHDTPGDKCGYRVIRVKCTAGKTKQLSSIKR